MVCGGKPAHCCQLIALTVPQEDAKLTALVASQGAARWSNIALHMDGRTYEDCKQRYTALIIASCWLTPLFQMDTQA